MHALGDDNFTVMRIHWRLLHCPQRVKCWMGEKMEYCHLTMFTLCYNQFTSGSTMLDAALEPLFWLVDHFTKYMGPVSTGIFRPQKNLGRSCMELEGLSTSKNSLVLSLQEPPSDSVAVPVDYKII